MKVRMLAAALGAVALSGIPGAGQAGTLEDVQERGTIKCGISDNLPGFAFLDSAGAWSGFDVDYCKAFSTAVFGTPDKVDYVPLAFNQSFGALQSGEVDVLSRSVTYTISRDTQLGMNFIPPNFYTGQSFMTHKSLDVGSVNELDGAAVCVLAGSVTERYIADYFRAKGMAYKPVAVETTAQMFPVYESGRCDAISHETPSLAVARSRLKAPEEHVILPEVIAKSYQTPVVRENDDRWFDIMRWTHFALVTAEELGVTSENVATLRDESTDPIIRTFLGVDGEIGSKMGLADDWTVKLVEAVGNYGELYDRNIGADSPLAIPRGMNDIAQRGGLLFAPSWR
ncbi:amino acid ABC transporter substrate-binding protein [Geminicoccaceae bacterium 1502E]|nr:amino acid ABC transporter substrate-binding protein [Geminicoccaceae bacterium 1502E]